MALNRLMAGLRGGGQGDQPAGKRQRRGDVLSALGDFGAAPGRSSSSSSAAPARGGGPAATAGAAPGGSAAAKKAADVEAMKQWLQSESEGQPAAEAAAAEPAAAEAAPSEAAAEPPEAGAAEEASPEAPARIQGDAAPSTGWQSKFAGAKDRWDVDKGALRCLYWHTETGCCFEWDQGSGTLFQYAEEPAAGGGPPALRPIWSSDCPDQHAWIWDTLPMPPTDPAAQEDEEVPLAAEGAAEPGGAPGAERAGSSAPSGAASGGGSMPPPPAPPKRSGSSASSMPPPPLPLKRARGPSDPGAASAASGAGADSAAAAPPAEEGPRAPGAKGQAAEADDEDAGPTEGGILDDDDLLESLAAGEVSELPPAPAVQARPQACDLDLDIFGLAEEAAEPAE